MDLITTIPLSSSRRNDSWYLRWETSGSFSVKSVYKFLQCRLEDLAQAQEASIWKQLWDLKVPAKVCHLVWRAASGSLPTKFQLQQKHVFVDPWCPFCGAKREMILHCLVECGFARACWIHSGFLTTHSISESFFDWPSCYVCRL